MFLCQQAIKILFAIRNTLNAFNRLLCDVFIWVKKEQKKHILELKSSTDYKLHTFKKYVHQYHCETNTNISQT